MSTLKKTLYAGLAAVTMATTGTAFTSTPAEAHYKYKKHYKHYKYKKHYGYKHSCFFKKVWRKNYYGHGHWVTVKVCR